MIAGRMWDPKRVEEIVIDEILDSRGLDRNQPRIHTQVGWWTDNQDLVENNVNGRP